MKVQLDYPRSNVYRTVSPENIKTAYTVPYHQGNYKQAFGAGLKAPKWLLYALAGIGITVGSIVLPGCNPDTNAPGKPTSTPGTTPTTIVTPTGIATPTPTRRVAGNTPTPANTLKDLFIANERAKNVTNPHVYNDQKYYDPSYANNNNEEYIPEMSVENEKYVYKCTSINDNNTKSYARYTYTKDPSTGCLALQLEPLKDDGVTPTGAKFNYLLKESTIDGKTYSERWKLNPNDGQFYIEYRQRRDVPATIDLYRNNGTFMRKYEKVYQDGLQVKNNIKRTFRQTLKDWWKEGKVDIPTKIKVMV